MELIERLFPRYDERGIELIHNAYNIALEALSEHKRSNGQPFIEHPMSVAKIACDEIGLSAECVAAVFLHEATRFFPETAIPKGMFGQDVMTMVDGLLDSYLPKIREAGSIGEFLKTMDIDIEKITAGTLTYYDEENEEMAIFCVNKSLDESVILDVNLMDFGGYKPVEFISMDGYHKKDENSFDAVKVKPHTNAIPELDGSLLTAELKPFSWNVIRLKK